MKQLRGHVVLIRMLGRMIVVIAQRKLGTLVQVFVVMRGMVGVSMKMGSPGRSQVENLEIVLCGHDRTMHVPKMHCFRNALPTP